MTIDKIQSLGMVPGLFCLPALVNRFLWICVDDRY